MDKILRATLSDILDDVPINGARLTPTSPIKQLIDDYQYYAGASAALDDYQVAWTGGEFKTHIAQLTPEQQLILLYRYAESRGEQMDDRRDNAAKRWQRVVTKVVVWTLCICAIMMVGAVSMVAVRSGHGPSNEVVSAFFEMAVKIARVLMSNGKGGEF